MSPNGLYNLHRCLEERESFTNKGTFRLKDHSPSWDIGLPQQYVRVAYPVVSRAVCHAKLAVTDPYAMCRS